MGRFSLSRFFVVCGVVAALSACGSGSPSATSAIPQTYDSSQRALVRPTPVPTATPVAFPSTDPATLPILTDTNPSTSGVFLGAVCSPGVLVTCPNFANVFRHGIALGTIYTDWQADFTNLIVREGIDAWVAAGITPEFTWQPPTNITFADVNNGVYDAYFIKSAQELKAFGSTVFLRPFHEFNGNWYPWGLANQGGSSATDAAFISAWQRMVTIFHEQGATNVRFVWCFSTGGLKNDLTYPWNNPANAYPGDAYVDWIGYDTYNRGNLTTGVKWKFFDDITLQSYQVAVAIAPHKPIAVSEMASTEYGDGGAMKTTWVTGMLRELESPANPYPNIKLLSWFEPDIRGYVYDLQSSTSVYQQFANGVRLTDPNGVPYIRSNSAALANVVSL